MINYIRSTITISPELTIDKEDNSVLVCPIKLALVNNLISLFFEIDVGPKPIAIEEPSTQKAISPLLIISLAVISFILFTLVSK